MAGERWTSKRVKNGEREKGRHLPISPQLPRDFCTTFLEVFSPLSWSLEQATPYWPIITPILVFKVFDKAKILLFLLLLSTYTCRDLTRELDLICA